MSTVSDPSGLSRQYHGFLHLLQVLATCECDLATGPRTYINRRVGAAPRGSGTCAKLNRASLSFLFLPLFLPLIRLATGGISLSQRMPQKNAWKSICHVACGNNSLWMPCRAATKAAITLKGQRFVRFRVCACARAGAFSEKPILGGN